MKDIHSQKAMIMADKYNDTFETLYGKTVLEEQKHRYINLLNDFSKYYNLDEDTKVFMISAPGRSEIGGNHTDHQNGCVLAASINLDAIAIVTLTEDNIVTIKSEGFIEDSLCCDDLNINKEEINTSLSVIRGVLAGIKNHGGKIGGLKAYTTSSVLMGSGLSSSAAFEVLVGEIINHGYNDGSISAIDIAKIGQYAENVYFSKPSGLLDQMSSSVGGFVAMDFKDTKNIIIDKVDFDFSKCGYSLCIVDTGGDHSNLTDYYADVPKEMKQIAKEFSKEVLREVDEGEFYTHIPSLRRKYGDRAVLRSIHFFNENKRAREQVEALKNNDFTRFLYLINESGKSSFSYLQNVSTFIDTKKQNIPIALAVAEHILERTGAVRVHGGGFAGTIQIFAPNEKVDVLKKSMSEIFGEKSFYLLSIRPVGGVKINENLGILKSH